jgi:hypothetical protein
MTRCRSLAPLGCEFDRFLFAPIGLDGNGMLLSVLSALARLDVDPWQEAAQLAALPRDAAVDRLATLIAALPDGSPAKRDPGKIAGGLLELLPRQVRADVPSDVTARGAGRVTDARVIMFVIVMTIVLGAQYLMASHPSQAHDDDAHGPASVEVLPSTPLSNSGQ